MPLLPYLTVFCCYLSACLCRNHVLFEAFIISCILAYTYHTNDYIPWFFVVFIKKKTFLFFVVNFINLKFKLISVVN